MKLNLINESTDITGKLDPLIVKYEKLKASAADNDIFYENIVNKLKSSNTVENLKNFLKSMYDNLNDIVKSLKILKLKAVPSNSFATEEYSNKYKIYANAVSTYNDIVSYCKNIKIF